MNKTYYRTCKVDGIEIFYREAGSPDHPGVLLLHGWPSLSRMFEKLIPTLSDRYYVIAPDYPAFGHSDTPVRTTFEYSFDNFTDILEHFIEKVGSCEYTMYVHDFGGPGWLPNRAKTILTVLFQRPFRRGGRRRKS